jgi:hypothetical protein
MRGGRSCNGAGRRRRLIRGLDGRCSGGAADARAPPPSQHPQPTHHALSPRPPPHRFHPHPPLTEPGDPDPEAPAGEPSEPEPQPGDDPMSPERKDPSIPNAPE